MTTVVGLDLSLTASGIAVLTDDLGLIPYRLPADATDWQQQPGVMWPIALRTFGIDGHESDGYRERNRRIRHCVKGVVDIVKGAAGPIHLIAVEAMLPVTKTFYSYGDRWAHWHAVYGAFDAIDIPIAVVVNTTAHQFTTGVGRVSEDKHEVIEATSTWWPNIEVLDHNIGDAVGLGGMAGMHKGMKLPFRPGARHYSAIHGIHWPGTPRPPKTWAQQVKAKKARRA